MSINLKLKQFPLEKFKWLKIEFYLHFENRMCVFNSLVNSQIRIKKINSILWQINENVKEFRNKSCPGYVLHS